MEIEEEDTGLKSNASRYEFTSSEAVPLETVISHTFSSSSPEEPVSVLRRAILSICEPLRACTKTGLEATLEGKARRRFRHIAVAFLKVKKCRSLDIKLAHITFV